MDQRERFKNAFEEHNDALFRHCVLRVSEREIAVDLVQDAFASTWGYIAKGKEVRNMRAFLFRTLNNSIIDYYRKKKSSSLDAIAEHVTLDVFEDLHDEESLRWADMIDGEELIHKLKELPDIYMQVLSLRYVEGFSPKEISELIGESENVVSVRIHRGVKKLTEFVEAQTS